jgi:cytoskeletal protein CcmA (bactofilin family)
MASTYTDIGTELMTTGENAGNWGTKTNVNLQILEEAIRGYVAVSANSDQTLSLTDGSTGDSIRNSVIAFTGTLSANRTITVPAVEKWWIMDNQTAGAYTLTVKVSGQTGITWGTSDKGTKILYGNGTDVVDTNIGGGVGAYDLNGNELTLDADADTSITASTDDQIDFEIAGADDFTMTANAFNVLTGSHVTFADSANAKFGTGNDMLMYHDGSNSYITNALGALKVATETSGIAVTIGHTTSEVTVADNLTVTGTLTLGSGAELTEAELEFLDGITAGTAAASKAMVLDSNADITGGRNLTISGELDAATGDFSGDVDIDGTLEADAITINGTAIGSVYGAAAGSSSIVTTGALDSGSITSGFGAIDNGTSNIRSATITAETAFVPDASGGADLGTTSLEFNDLFLNDSGSIQFGDDQDTTLVHTDGTGLTLNSTNKLCFYDTALYIHSSTDGQLDLVADTEIQIAATTVDVNGILDVSGVIVAGGQISAADGTAGAPSISNTGDLNSGLYFSAADTLAFSAGGTAQFTMADGAIAPVTDNDVDLGTSGLEFKDGYFDGTLYCDQLNLNGTNHTTIEDPTALAIALG